MQWRFCFVVTVQCMPILLRCEDDSAERAGVHRHAGGITVRTVEAGDETRLDRVVAGRKHDRHERPGDRFSFRRTRQFALGRAFAESGTFFQNHRDIIFAFGDLRLKHVAEVCGPRWDQVENEKLDPEFATELFWSPFVCNVQQSQDSFQDNQGGRIVETAVEARGGLLGRPV
jgi:hypothetical protein